ncbi:MAG: DUF4236 domain-containing protein [Bacillota bacterium]|nr:DUF4236 domain-containing protein [Bacillota bacterium]
MGIRFRRSIGLGKGVKLNLSKGGLGLSAGVKGARVGIGPRGAYRSLGIPETGLYAIDYMGKSKRKKNIGAVSSQPGEMPVMATNLPVPPEIKTSMPLILLVTSILLLSFRGIGVIGLGLYAFLWLKSPKWKANRHYKSGKKLYLKGQHAEALQEFEKVVALVPETFSLCPLMAVIAFQQNDYHQVVDYYEAYLDKDPDNVIVRFNYGIALSEADRDEEAIRELQKLPEEMAKELPVLIALGNALMKSGKHEQAVAILETGPTRKQKMDGLMKMFRYVLGCAYEGAGDVKKAVKQFQKVAAFDMHFEDVSERLARFETD